MRNYAVLGLLIAGSLRLALATPPRTAGQTGGLAQPAGPTWRKPLQDFRLSARSPRSAYPVGEDIPLKIWVQNVGKKVEKIQRPQVLDVFKFKVIGPDGKPVPMTQRGKELLEASQGGSRSEEEIKPMEEAMYYLELRETFGMQKPGNYQVTATMDVPKAGEKDKFDTVTSNPLTITIAPAKAKKGK